MKLVILSYAFAPSIGGIETSTAVLAERFHMFGHDVTVISHSLDPAATFRAPYKVLRRPSFRDLLSVVNEADAVIQNNITLRYAWLLYGARLLSVSGLARKLSRKPLLTVLQTYISTPEGVVRWQHRLKFFALRFGRNYAVSKHLCGSVPVKCEVMPNPYADDVFLRRPFIKRIKPLLFVGRLTAAKGCDTAIEALAGLHENAKTQEERLTLSVVGLGPDETALQQLAVELDVASYVHFLGPKRGQELASVMNEHQLLLVPSRSRPPEALGIVALEGIACGCVPVVSDQGGLPEAVGQCGAIFPEGDHRALAEEISRLLGDPSAQEEYRKHASTHLAWYKPDNVAAEYLKALRREGFERDRYT